MGRGSSTVWYRGPLKLADAAAEASLRWDRADVGGMPLGPGELKAALAHGAFAPRPWNWRSTRAASTWPPRLDSSPGPLTLSLPAGPLADQVQVDPAMLRSVLRYAAPALANVTIARGTISVAARFLPHSAGRSGQQRHFRPVGDSLAGDWIGADAPRLVGAPGRRRAGPAAGGIGRGLPHEGPPHLPRGPGVGVPRPDASHQRLGRDWTGQWT